MKHKENTSIHKADDGKLIVRKSDNFIMGDSIDLGSADNIDNYEEREFTEEEINSFYESVGLNIKQREGKKHED
jgi:hypothetical protein